MQSRISGAFTAVQGLQLRKVFGVDWLDPIATLPFGFRIMMTHDVFKTGPCLYRYTLYFRPEYSQHQWVVQVHMVKFQIIAIGAPQG